jgi:rhamnose utilization protein RhaD (predicted bifunctional aldolase and dehydrogenase)
MSTIEPEGHIPLDLHYLRQLCTLAELDDAMSQEFQMHRLAPGSAGPSIESLTRAYLPEEFIGHTHANAILALTNQVEGEGLLREALGEGVALVDYVKPGFKLAKAIAAAYDAHPNCRAMVWMRHGITTWGPTAREAYEAMIDLVTRAEDFAARRATKAAAHQLAHIASQEMADLGVRVNTVAPDAVFSHGARRSGLWAEVGPDRMGGRSLDEKGLEDYYRSRNLLKVTVTAQHVSRAVLHFATRQTPTTGATIPVDGGLPDSTPR